MLSMHPRGATSEQIIWRLKSAGLRVNASELLTSLSGLVRSGEIIRTSGGRWRIAQFTSKNAAGLRQSETPATNLKIEHGYDGDRLFAVRAQVKFKPLSVEPTLASNEIAVLPEWSALLGYYAATQRQDPRGQIEEFADGHAKGWQLFQTTGRWWANAELRISAASVPDSFRESLARRKINTAALGWPISIVKTPSGKEYIPALIIPANWRFENDQVLFTLDGSSPSINPAWVREIRRCSTWQEQALIDALMPEGEDSDLAAISDRMVNALATLGGGLLRPAELSNDLTVYGPVIRNNAAIFLPEDRTFTKGAAEDLEALRLWPEALRVNTALGSLLANSIPQEASSLDAPPLTPVRSLTDIQTDAAHVSLKGPITVIQGPPGTGKSEVILALIVSALMSRRTVLFAAKNHQAIDEVERRLRAIIPCSPVMVRARDAEGEQDNSFLDALADLAVGRPDDSEQDVEVAPLLKTGRAIERTRVLAKQLQKRQVELSELTERREVLRQGMAPTAKAFSMSFWRRLILSIFQKFRRSTDSELPETANLAQIERRLRDLLGALKKEMIELPIDQNGLTDFSASVTDTLPNWVEACVRANDDEWLFFAQRMKELEFQKVKAARRMPPDDARAIVQKRPVWATSTLSAPARIPLVPALFDYVIFDEASQCDIASALPLFARAKIAVIVGDPMQLRFVASLGALTEHALMDAAGLPPNGRSNYAQSINSLFDFAQKRPAAQRTFLADQFRSAPAIVDYLNKDFYNGRLIGRRDDDTFSAPRDYKPGLTWENVTGQVIRRDGGNVNLQEAERIATLVQRMLKNGFDGEIGIISPFNAQVGAIQVAVQRLGIVQDKAKLRIATVDKFQGGEADVILFSLVLAPSAPTSAWSFLQKERRRLNVAVSRARAVCIVVGDLAYARSCRIPHIEFLAQRASMPWSPPRPQLYESEWERRLATAMEQRGLSPISQYPVGTRYLDFALDPEGKKIDVEVDGRRWHTDASGNRKVADRLRDMELRSRGWKVIRFWVHELAEDMGGCLDRIERILAE